MALFFVVTTLSVLFVSICSARHIFKNFCANTHFSCTTIFCGESYVNRNQEQYAEDRVFAESLQRRLNEEERQRERLLKRKERRMWYEYYMKPWTMLVEKSDILHANPEEDVEANMMQIDTKPTPNDCGGRVFDSDSEELNEDTGELQIPQCRVCDDDDENATLYLRLPGSGRCVDGTCAFCLDEYEVGDKIVWSDLECPHVFHKECLMLWLSKGKKRCPVCRHWFVPGSKIDDQKHLHGEAWQHALREMEKIEKEENEKQMIEDENKTKLGNGVEQGIAEIISTVPSSQSITSRITYESVHSKSEHDELGCNILQNNSRDSAHLSVCEMNDIESHGMVASDARPAVAHDSLSDKNSHETKRERQISRRSEQECVFLGE